MNFDQFIKLLEAIAPLLQVLIWPIIIVFLWRAFKIYVEDLRKDKNVSEMGIDVSATGLKFNFKKQVDIATYLVQSNVAKRIEEGATHPTLSTAQKDAIVDVVSHVTQLTTAQRIAGTKLLWVDDHHENNVY